MGTKAVKLFLPCEEKLLSLLAKGLSNKAIGDELGWQLSSVNSQLSRIYEKLDIPDNSNARVVAIKYFNGGEIMK